MIKYLILLTILPGIVLGQSREDSIRTRHFPKTDIVVSEMPNKENVWVFLLAGQSNMAGRGLVESEDTIPSDRILTINQNNELILAKEPLHFYEPIRTGLDIGLSFGRELLKHIPDSISILLLPTAVGGSSILQWLENATYRDVQLFSNFQEKVKIGKEYGEIKAVLWHQGETDASSEKDISKYKKRLSKLVKKFRDEAGNSNLPVLIGELGSYSKNNDQWSRINEQIYMYVATDSHAKVVPTGDLTDKGDKIHFSTESVRILGRRFANAYYNW